MPQMAQAAMSGATQAAASQTKETKTVVKKDNSLMDDIYKGAATVALVGRGLDSITDAAQGAMKLYDQQKLRSAYDEVDKAYRDGGMGAVQQLDTNFWNNTAIGQFMKDRANNEKGRLEMMQNADAVADKIYQDWRIQASGVAKAYQSGDMQQFMPLMKQLSEQSPLPYKLEPDQSGNFKVLFRSDEKGGWTDTGRQMTPQEAMGEVNSVMRGEQIIARGLTGELLPVNRDFNLAVGRNILATAHGNADNRTDPRKVIPLYDKNGNVGGFARIQNPIPTEDNPYAYTENSKVIAFGHDGQNLGVFDGYDGVMKYGLSPFAPKKGKGGAGSNGVGTAGPKNAAAHQAMLSSGYIWDSKQHGYFQASQDADGKWQPDLSKPASPEFISEIIRRTGNSHQTPMGQPRNSGGADPLGLRGSGQQPVQPQQQTHESPRAQGRIQEAIGLGLQGGQQALQASQSQNSAPATSSSLPMAGLNLKGSLTSYSKNGVTQWAVIGPNGQPQEITPEQAQAYGRQIDIAARQERQAEGQRNMERMWGGNSNHGRRVTARDVWNELSEEEKSNWRSTGNLPGRYNQVR